MLALKTIRQPWIALGTMDATAGAADATLAVGERRLSDVSSLDNVVYKEVPLGLSVVELRFKGTTNNHDYIADLWVGRLDNGKATLTRACTLTLKCGQQTSLIATDLLIDTITVSNEIWNKALVPTDTGTDVEARLLFDMCGYDLILLHGHTTFDSDLKVELSGYH